MKIPIPTLKTFKFTVDGRSIKFDDGAGNSDNTFYVTFRQGETEADNQRSDWASKRLRKLDDDGDIVEVSVLSPDALAELEVFLTLTDTDLEMNDGRKLEFTQGPGYQKVKNRTQFAGWWGQLPTPWAQLIYQCCMEVNPDWGSKSRVVL